MTERLDRHDIELHQAAGRQDTRLLAALAKDIWTEHYVPLIGPGQVTYMLDRFQSNEQIYCDITQNGYTYIWLTLAGSPVAYMAWQNKPDNACFLSKLYVRKSHRSRGLARLMMNHLVCCCRERNARNIWLTVNKNNTQSIKVYKKMMFYIIDAVVTDIGGGYVMDDYVMQRDL